MDMPEFTPRNIAKHVATAVVGAKVNEMVRNAAEDYTRFDKDDKIVKIGAGVVAWGVSSRLKPYTDKAVDKTADWIVAKREARKANQKDNTESE